VIFLYYYKKSRLVRRKIRYSFYMPFKPFHLQLYYWDGTGPYKDESGLCKKIRKFFWSSENWTKQPLKCLFLESCPILEIQSSAWSSKKEILQHRNSEIRINLYFHPRQGLRQQIMPWEYCVLPRVASFLGKSESCSYYRSDRFTISIRLWCPAYSIQIYHIGRVQSTSNTLHCNRSSEDSP
jgi:hypothetical protein